MYIGIIDAEIMGKSKHRFPNLVCMKLSAYYKEQGDKVELCLDYNDIDKYDKIFLSKVFIKTDIPCEPKIKNKTEQNVIEYYSTNSFLQNPKLEYGGTGFYYEKAPKLSYEIEHHMPDYHLYDKWIEDCVIKGAKSKEFTYYKDYSIGFLTRGCFRQCQFCVNKVYKKCEKHSDLNEFYQSNRKKLCFLDDNFFACPQWKEIIETIKSTKKPFQFKQGLDERLLTEEKIKEMATWKYDGNFIFAFDNISDEDLIVSKLNMIYDIIPNWKHQMKFYCFCGYDRNGIYDEEFWINDIENLFKRIKILSKYSAFPYVMRHENYHNSNELEQIYNTICSWCNQPSIFSGLSFEEYCKAAGMPRSDYKIYRKNFDKYLFDGGKKYSTWKSYDKLIEILKEKNKTENFNQYLFFVPRGISEHGLWVRKYNV